MPISERKKEIKRRRHRRKKFEKFSQRLSKANEAEKNLIADKLRGLTPGAEKVIESWGLESE